MPSATRRRSDIFVYGDLCDFDLIFGEYLARKGYEVAIGRKVRQARATAIPAGFLKEISDENIHPVRGPLDLVRQARKARVVLTFTGSFGMGVRLWWSARRILGIPPVINLSTGSDFGELLADRTHLGMWYRYFVRGCFTNGVPPYPSIIRNIKSNGVNNCFFVKYAYALGESPTIAPVRPSGGRMRYFHPSNIDFGMTDSRAGRTSTKGNDRFIRAFIKAVRSGIDAECVMLFRGPDRAVARQMFAEANLADRVIWKEDLSRDDLNEEILDADVIVDQFDVGGLGGIAVEAMHLGKPVMMYFDEPAGHLLYDECPPLINVRSEAEIYDAITQCAGWSPEKFADLGEQSRNWVREHHDGETCLDQLMFFIDAAAGRVSRDG